MKRNILSAFMAGALTVAAQSSEAAVLIAFDDSPSGVITATASSSIDLTGLFLTINDRDAPATVSNAGTDTLFTWVVGSPSYDPYTGGVSAASGLTTVPDINANSSFGFSNNAIFVPFDTTINGVYTLPANFSWQWNAEDLADIGLGSLSTSSPLTVWTNPNASGTDGIIQFIAIPEPSAALLILISLAFLIHRRRSYRHVCSGL